MHRRLNTTSQSLQRLRPANLATVNRHRSIITHILRLEWRHTHAIARQQSAQPRHQHRFTDARSGALNHQRFHD